MKRISHGKMMVTVKHTKRMGDLMKQKESAGKPGLKRKIFIVTMITVAAAVIFATACNKNNLATTMRLLRSEGTVSIEDSKGTSKPVIENLKFRSGDALVTGSDGLASVGLDETKIVTLQNDSRTEFVKNGNQLELKLTKGAVFFNVTEKLRSDEKFEIKTSTMTAGIRGTSGIVYYDSEDGNRESLMVTDGTVEVSATNPDTNETRTVKVEGGKSVKVYFYNNDTQHESVEFVLKEISEADLSRFMLNWLADDLELIDRISTFTGWDKNNLKKALLGLAGGEITPTSGETSASKETSRETSGETSGETSAETTKKPTRKPTKKPTRKPTRRPTRKPAKKKKKASKPTSTTSSGTGGCVTVS